MCTCFVIRSRFFAVICLLALFCGTRTLFAQKNTVGITWDKVTAVSKTTPTLQVVVNPMLHRGSPIHDGTFEALKMLGADYVRFVPWFPYPHMAVAELKPPTATETFWDFSHVDPMVEDLMKATEGHSVIINFSTIPVWMFKTEKPVEVPADPDQVFWDYNPGTELRDTTLKELTDYYVRLFSWYTQGGFTDELGKYHKSGYHYKIPYWEVLNEPDLEHHVSPELYTRIYDAVVTALKKISPETRFVALALASENNPEYFEYFLNPANHAPGVPLEGISYHFYGTPSDDKITMDNCQYSFFDKADGFIDKARYIESIRKRLAPGVFTTADEIGNILAGSNYTDPIPKEYWNLSGAMYAYVYLQLMRLGIDIAGESQLVGYPTQFPDVSMMNWKNGKPNARFWVLKLLKDNFGPGDKLVATSLQSRDLVAQAFVTEKGKKLLLINKRNEARSLTLPAGASEMQFVDVSTGDGPAAQRRLTSGALTLTPFSVAVVTFK
ncbi:glycosyl hydrolase family 39 [Compostibacter hankyongensis]|uniref:D-apionate lactonase C-terminal domain-containing protein n=1 Tax=Compostibacter hankyongensis TaxID=1007089 RepID=A0ABP8FIY1_9BACT